MHNSIRTTHSIIRTCVLSVLLYMHVRPRPEEQRHRLADGIWQEMLKKNSPHTLAHKITNIEIRQRFTERKLNLFGHICRMDDNRLVKNVLIGIAERQNRRGRRAGSGWTTSKNGGGKLLVKHWTPTDASPWNEEDSGHHIQFKIQNCRSDPNESDYVHKRNQTSIIYRYIKKLKYSYIFIAKVKRGYGYGVKASFRNIRL